MKTNRIVVTEMECKYCGSENLIKRGKSAQGKQIYSCKDCSHKSVDNGNYARMRTNKRAIVTALDLYFEGLSVRKIKRQTRKIFGIGITQVAIWKWVKKYSELVKKYVDTLKIEHHSGEFHADETVVFCDGIEKWFWEIMDGKTKFLLASRLSDVRKGEDAEKLFREAKMRIKEKQKHIYTDGLWAYRAGFKRPFYDRRGTTELVQNVGLKSRVTNNVVERLHGTLKDRLKVMRGLETAEAMLKGWFVHYNFVRPHQSLDGRTPAEAAGVNLNMNDGWGDLIELATKHETMNNR